MSSIAAAAPWPDWIMSYHRRPLGSASDIRLAGQQVVEEAHIVGMVGDDQEVERPRQLGELSRGGHDLLAFAEAIGVARSEARTEGAGIEGEGGVGVGVAEQRPRREVSSGPGRIGPLGRIELVGGFLVQGAGIQQRYPALQRAGRLPGSQLQERRPKQTAKVRSVLIIVLLQLFGACLSQLFLENWSSETAGRSEHGLGAPAFISA